MYFSVSRITSQADALKLRPLHRSEIELVALSDGSSAPGMSTSEQSLFCLGISHAVDPICNNLHIQVGLFRNLGCSLHAAPHMFVTAASDDQVLGESVRLLSLLRSISTLPGPFHSVRLMHRLSEVLLIKIKRPVQNIPATHSD